jgi:hypothetical protein
VNRPDLTIATFEGLIDRGVPVPMIGDGMSRFHVRRYVAISCTSLCRDFMYVVTIIERAAIQPENPLS